MVWTTVRNGRGSCVATLDFLVFGAVIIKRIELAQFDGMFRFDARHGHGRFVSLAGNIFVGNFANDVIDGSGVATASDGTLFAGSFVNGSLVAPGVEVTFGDGLVKRVASSIDVS